MLVPHPIPLDLPAITLLNTYVQLERKPLRSSKGSYQLLCPCQDRPWADEGGPKPFTGDTGGRAMCIMVQSPLVAPVVSYFQLVQMHPIPKTILPALLGFPVESWTGSDGLG